VVKFVVAIDEPGVRFPPDAEISFCFFPAWFSFGLFWVGRGGERAALGALRVSKVSDPKVCMDGVVDV
jgi:hypothetical protein